MRFKGKLYPFQLEGVAFCLQRRYSILNFEQGLGKTITFLAIAYKASQIVGRPLKVLVVVPAFLRKNWLSEAEKFTEGLDITVISYAQLSKVVGSYDIIGADESQYLKNHKAKRTVNFHKIISESTPKYMVLMSGTPIKNNVAEFWSPLQLCYYGGNFEVFKPFYKLYYKFCHYFSFERTFDINVNGKSIPIVRFEGVKNPDKLKNLLSHVLIRKRAIDCLDLPKEIEKDIVLKNSSKHDAEMLKAYEMFKQDASDPAYMSIKRANAVAKVHSTIDFVSGLVEQQKRVVVFTCHQESARELAKKFKVPYIDGTVPADNRQKIVDEFNDGKYKVLIATIGSASTGFNLTSANYMVFNDLPFVPADIEQAKKRILRIGQESTCFYYYIFTSDVDKNLADMIKRKSRDIRKIYG